MKITIIGLGLIGGSIAKTLSGSKAHQILAFDTNQSSISNALENQSIQESLESLDELKRIEYEDSLVIIATPPSVTNDILKSLEFLFNSSVTITDTTSTKSSLNKILQKFNFPENIIFSHPVAGSHLSGEINSIDDLFKGKSTILSYHDSAASLHVNRVMSLWTELGSKVSVLDAELHDQIFAYSSHLPHVAAYALLNTLKGLDQDDLALFSGGGLGEFLRLASSSPEMWTDIFSMNEKNISSAINDLVQSLNILQDKIENDPKSLQDFLSELKAFKESKF
ncbi:prephenate dehydrogenase [Gammaproteobacteria bacterium]|nr:prephenate dehydrogenase [Gammaproteobacteria bacterium]MDA8798657.1 prephenate dehydrogenase [Gammaproteobacteria bacterium]MDC0919277.1 prephenate dehydrogenase [Gammaproteobacteria bacterium]